MNSITFQNMMPLTARQREVYDFFVSFREEHGYSPTIREAGKHLGISSPNGVVAHVDALKKKGWLRNVKAAASRSIVPSVLCAWRASPPVPGWYVCVVYASTTILKSRRELVFVDRDVDVAKFSAFYGPIGGIA